MIRHLKKYLAIRSYVRRLSQDLERRFDWRHYYSIEQVRQAAERGRFSTAFMAYAHAAFCNAQDFTNYYGPLGVACNYEGLRRTIARRYLSGKMNFDAETIIVAFHRGPYYGGNNESGGAEDVGHG
jgi:hypothetical protein